MQIILNNSSMIPIYEQLMSQIKASVIAGETKAGDALPSVRNLASDLKISALTVKKAYDKLEEEGFIVTVHGKGSFVAETNNEFAYEARKQEIEAILEEDLSRAVAYGFTKEEIKTLVDILLEDK